MTVNYLIAILTSFLVIGFVHCQIEIKEDFENKKLSIFNNKCDSSLELPTIDTYDFGTNLPVENNGYYAIVRGEGVKCFETSYLLVPSTLKIQIQHWEENVVSSTTSKIEVEFIKNNGDHIGKKSLDISNNIWKVDIVEPDDPSLNFVKVRVKITSAATDFFAINYISFNPISDTPWDLDLLDFKGYAIAAAALVISLVAISAISFLCLICICISNTCKMNSLQKSNDRLTTVIATLQQQIQVSHTQYTTTSEKISTEKST